MVQPPNTPPFSPQQPVFAQAAAPRRTASQATFYRSSGKAPPAGVLMGFGLGAVASIVLGFVYAYAIVYVPVVGIFTFLLSAGFGFGVGAATAHGFHLGKVRNEQVAWRAGLLVALFALYVSWAAWVFALLNRADVDISLIDAFNPLVLVNAILGINETGAWSLSSYTPTGIVLWVLWGLEALIIVIIASVTAETVSSTSFCEQCNQWCEEEVLPAMRARGALNPNADVEKELLKQRLEQQRDLSGLASFGATDNEDDHYRFLVERCGCSATNTFTIRHVLAHYDDKNERSQQDDDFFKRMLLNADEVNWLKSLG